MPSRSSCLADTSRLRGGDRVDIAVRRDDIRVRRPGTVTGDEWNAVDARIRASQRRRLFLRALGKDRGAFPNWAFEARPGDAGRFVRPSTAGGPVGPKPRARFPFVQPTPPDRR